MVSLVVEDADSGKSILEFIYKRYPGAEQKTLIRTFKKGDITLNRENARGDDEVRAGDNIRLYVSEDTLGAAQKPEIIYQDENFVIADKPAGLLSISDKGEPNAVQMVEDAMKRQGEFNIEALIVPYLVYPLDKYVSGLIILAKHEDAYLFLAEALSQRRIARHFICPVAGNAKEKDELLAYHLHNKATGSVHILSSHRKSARPIVTRYTKIAAGEDMTLLRVRPITNYLHQVRAHLAYEGFPVVGDDLFGDRRFNKRHRASSIALWLKTVIFEIGTNHSYAYLNGKRFESNFSSFPKCVYDAGLIEID